MVNKNISLAAQNVAPSQVKVALAKAFPTWFGGGTAAPQKVKAVKVAALHAPFVSLLPPRLAIAKAKRSTIRGFMFAAYVIGVITLLLWGGSGAIGSSAQQERADANAKVVAAQARLDKQHAVQDFFTAVQDRQSLIASKTGRTVSYEQLGLAVTAALPVGASLTSFDVAPLASTVTAETDNLKLAATCGTVTDPIGSKNVRPVACLKIGGTATSLGAVTAYALELQKSGLVSNVSLTGSASSGTNTTGGTPFTGTAVITNQAVTLSPELLEANVPGAPALPSGVALPGGLALPTSSTSTGK